MDRVPQATHVALANPKAYFNTRWQAYVSRAIATLYPRPQKLVYLHVNLSKDLKEYVLVQVAN